MIPLPPRSTLFPYTTLFRSELALLQHAQELGLRLRAHLPHFVRSEEHTSELQSLTNLVCRLLLEKKKRRPSAERCERTCQHPLLSDTSNSSDSERSQHDHRL